MSEALTANLARAGLTVDKLREVLAGEGFGSNPALLHGSALRRQFDEHSDIDILVIAPNVSAAHVCIPCASTRLDIAVFSISRLHQELVGETSRGWDGIARTLMDGVPLQGEWRSVQDEARRLTASAPSVNFKLVRNRARSVFHDMARRDADSRIERLMLAKELVDAYCDILLRNHGFWSSNGVVALRRLKANLPHCFARLDFAVSAYVSQGKLEPLEEILAAQLGPTLQVFEPLRVGS